MGTRGAPGPGVGNGARVSMSRSLLAMSGDVDGMDRKLWGFTQRHVVARQDPAGATMTETRAARTWLGGWARGTTAAKTTITTASGWQARAG